MDKTLNHIIDSYYKPDNPFKEYKPPQHPLGPRATTPYNKPSVENIGRSSEQILYISDENENNDDDDLDIIASPMLNDQRSKEEEEIEYDTQCN